MVLHGNEMMSHGIGLCSANHLSFLLVFVSACVSAGVLCMMMMVMMSNGNGRVGGFHVGCVYPSLDRGWQPHD
jgi:ABC-type uncharacterized transport system YnjBCD permease subunit